MNFNARGGISILGLGTYGPALILAIFVCSRHGFGRASGWVYTLILCLSAGLLQATIILDTIGLAPLLLATLGLLSRSVDSISETSSTFLNMIHFRVIQLLVTLGLILSIVGGTSSVSSTGVYTIQTTSEAGAAIYIVAYLALAFVAFFTVLKISSVRYGESRIVWAVLIAMPLILVRLIYTLLTVFHHDQTFNVVSSSVISLVFMAILEELVVILVYLVVGWTTDTAPKTTSRPIEQRPWKGDVTAGAESTGRPTAGRGPIRGVLDAQPRSHRRARQGPIHTLVGMAFEAAQGGRDGVERRRVDAG